MATEGFKRKLTAIISADVAGYSRLMGEDESSTVKTLETYKRVFSDLILQHRGRLVDSTGDNLLAEFVSVVDAVQCALAVQKEIQSRNAELPETKRMLFRIGINLGDVIEEEGRIYGDGVNIAARLESLAEPGGICVSKTAFEQIETKLPLGYEYLGEQSVKNIAKPVPAYKVLMEPRVTVAKVKGESRRVPVWGRKALLTGAIAVLIVTMALSVWKFYFRVPPIEPASKEKMAFPLPDLPSIAVLPFTNMSGDPEQEYFSDGITEDLITDLSKIDGLLVIARNSVFTYKGKSVDVAQVARELGVRYVMEGSVRRGGEQVRINAQLIDASTRGHIWAERYDGQMDNVFVFQDSVIKKILAALEVKLTPDVQKRLAKKGTNNPEAYDSFLRGWAHYHRHTPEDFAKAVTFLEEAVKQDPQYSLAYSALALVYWEGAERHRWKHLDVSYAEAKLRAKYYLKEAMKAPTPLAHAVASQIHKRQGRYQEAIAEATQAIALDSSDPTGYRAMAEALIWSGNPLQSTDFTAKAMRLDPHNSSDYLDLLGMAQFNLEQFDKAVESLQGYIKRNPDAEWSYLWLAAAYGQLGSKQEAMSAIKSFNERMERIAWNYMSTLQGVEVLSLSDQKDADRLRKGLQIGGVPLGNEPVAKATMLISRTKEGHFAVEGAPTLEVDAAKALLDGGTLMIDVRPDAFWNRGHIPGAIHLPDNEVFSRAWLSRIAKEDQEVMIYCEGAE